MWAKMPGPNTSLVREKTLQQFRVRPGDRVQLKAYPTDWSLHNKLRDAGEEKVKEEARGILDRNLTELSRAQDVLAASAKYALLIVLQGIDAAGKDGTIKHVMSGLNPQGCQVVSFKQPSLNELNHDFLWRYGKALPERGRIGIFNRSHYEEVLVARVHPEWLLRQRLPETGFGQKFWRKRYKDINSFEHHLTRSGTVILKFFLHISKDEQKKRFLQRLANLEKYWKFSASDLEERQYWDAYLSAYEDALSATSTGWAPWYVIPADHKWSARVLIAEIITSEIRELKLEFPQPSREEMRRLREAQQVLEHE
jgi:PPK2 family polyphosphate:nucleotide phosphotransferase